MIWLSSYNSCLKRWSVTISSTSRKEWSASKFPPNLKKTTNKTRFLGQGTKENCWTKKTTRNFGMKHCFAWPKLQILRTKGFSFLYMKAGFTSVSVPKQSHKTQYLLPPKFEQKKKSFLLMNRSHLFCVAQKKIRDDGCCLLKNFTGPNQLYKVFLPVSPFQKKQTF